MSDKIEVIENLLGKVDRLLIGGAMAYTFFKSRGVPIGRSLVEDDKLDAARQIETHAKSRGVRLELPVDHVVADRVEAGAAHEVLAIGDARIGDRYGVDIGPATVRAYETLLADARTVIWNGPMGVFEIDAFAAGTNAVARAVANVKGTTIIGGGDSIAAIRKAGMADRVTHISTGGGASLEFLGGRTLPGVAALTDASGGTAGIHHENSIHRWQLEDVQDRAGSGRVRQGTATSRQGRHRRRNRRRSTVHRACTPSPRPRGTRTSAWRRRTSTGSARERSPAKSRPP